MLRVIAAFGRETYEYWRFRNQGQQAVDARVRLTVRQTAFSLAVTMLTAIGTALVLGFGAVAVIHHRMTAGDLLVVMGYVVAMYSPLQQISNTVSSLQEQFITLRGALRCSTRSPTCRTRPTRASSRGRGPRHLRARLLQLLRPPGHAQGLSFEAPGGSTVAIVGPTGAGKSTILALIARFHDPANGRGAARRQDIRSSSSPRCARTSASCTRSRCCSRSACATTSATAGWRPATPRSRRPPAGQRARLHHQASARLRHADRGTRYADVRRRAPADRRRPRVSQGRADPDPRRADVGDRLQNRGR